jgi:hypothetical protein
MDAISSGQSADQVFDVAAFTMAEAAQTADLALVETISEHVFAANRLSRNQSRHALERLRLVFWTAWVERCGLWISPVERAQAHVALRLSELTSSQLASAALTQARRAGTVQAERELAQLGD